MSALTAPARTPIKSKNKAERPKLEALSCYSRSMVLDWTLDGFAGIEPATKTQPLAKQTLFLEWQLDETLSAN